MRVMVSRALIGLVGIGFAIVGEARAASSDWWRTDHGALRLIAASDAAGDSRILNLGLHFRMIPGWKIYWRSPGDAGYPPQPDWSGSENVAHAELRWPAPERFSVLGFETVGYKDEVVLPVALALARPGTATRVRANVSYLTCDDICVPYEAKLELEIPAGAPTSSREAGLIERFVGRIPGPAQPGRGLEVVALELVASAGTESLQAMLRSETSLVRPDVFLEGPKGVNYAAPRVAIADDKRSAVVVILVRRATASDDLVARTMTITAVDGDRSVEAELVIGGKSNVDPASDATRANTGILVALLLALFGGLVLNLMPCVLPVLSLKVLAIVDHAGERGSIRRGFLATSCGIVTAFIVLAAIAILLKATGELVGWGIQFQEPRFLGVMAFVVALFSANLFGLFDIRLPQAVADRAATAGAGRGGWLGQFLTGAFAAVLATPCSAPFVGTAVGFALSRGALEILSIFIALGLGLALPYLVVAAVPGLALRLPRAGAWMVNVRRVMGVALLGTAAWLAVLLATQVGAAAAIAVGIAIVAVYAALLAWRWVRLRSPIWAMIAIVIAVGMFAADRLATVPALRAAARDTDIAWHRFDHGRIAAEVAVGRVVFVDVTADWCITCQVNKALVLDRGPVRDRLEAAGVIAMRADWTRPDPEISRFLASFGRYGIPFNVVFGPRSPFGETLSEILTPDAVMAAVERAANAGPLAQR